MPDSLVRVPRRDDFAPHAPYSLAHGVFSALRISPQRLPCTIQAITAPRIFQSQHDPLHFLSELDVWLKCVYLLTISGSFHAFPKALFTFRSRYLFTIGHLYCIYTWKNFISHIHIAISNNATRSAAPYLPIFVNRALTFFGLDNRMFKFS